MEAEVMIAHGWSAGAGKTTLLECLSMRNRDFEGALHFDGASVQGSFYTTTGETRTPTTIELLS
jgi:ABC-type branched-subunit amino acid transport system ATPase component